jgi:thiamine biosynthesis lipoprotein
MPKQTKIIMGMPITVEIIDSGNDNIFKEIFNYFRAVDQRFSPYKKDSELSKINKGLDQTKWSNQMKQIMELCQETKELSNGYFDIKNESKLDPSGLVKGWSIYQASKMLLKANIANFYVEAGGDIEVHGDYINQTGFKIGIRNPFKTDEIVKTVLLKNKGIATSGTYIRGDHIYNPKQNYKSVREIVSLTVIGPNVYEADRFATSAYAMGIDGINFIEKMDGFEGYMINPEGLATYTTNFERYVL